MKRSLLHFSILFSFFASLALSAGASAQVAGAPDIRSIPPAVMLLIDTSGSMERRLNCVCSTEACTECLPNCSSGPQLNRWQTLLAALTGTHQGLLNSCSATARPSSAYDAGYFIPHYTYSYFGSWPIDGPPDSMRNENGILDTYRERIKFGLMTFDTVGTLINERALMPESQFLSFGEQVRAMKGDFSYGPDKAFTFPNCGGPHMINNGVRRESQGSSDPVPGGLIPPGKDDEIGGSDGINRQIKLALLNPELRPFGATPIAGALDDLYYFFETHSSVRPSVTGDLDLGDPFHSCRDHYAILITDGYPNADMRGAPIYCESVSGCPYEPAETIAANLVNRHLDGLYVVGFDQDDPLARSRLEALAVAGRTEQPLWANDLDGLNMALSGILDRTAPGTTTRTVPAIASVSHTSLDFGRVAQIQVSSGFNVGMAENPGEEAPWSGVLERRRFECSGEGGAVVEQEITDEDRFHHLLVQQSLSGERKLFTVLPDDVDQPVQARITGRGQIDLANRPGGGGSLIPVPDPVYTTPIAANNRDLVLIDKSIAPEYFGAADEEVRDRIVDYMYASNSSTRRSQIPLGAIYHSSPTISSPPLTLIDDEGFNAFAQGRMLESVTGGAEGAGIPVSERPRVLYTATLDGILHAFITDDFPLNDPVYRAGQELWGFIPPALLPTLEGNLSGPKILFDGTPVIREIYDARTDSQLGLKDPFRTVLLIGFRGAVHGYAALDITDPLEQPKFLWQFVDNRLGRTVAEPAIAQVRVNGVSRAIALLPGGEGNLAVSGITGCPKGVPTSTVSGTPVARANGRCWQDRGRHLFAVDIATGEVIRHFDSAHFSAPLTGGISVFNGQIGAVGTRAFLTDADGTLYRVDLTGETAADWKVEPFYDLFHFRDHSQGQPAYHAPVISTDEGGNTVILVGTGNIDVLTDPFARNVVVSLTERMREGEMNAYEAELNWEIQLEQGELVTGPLELFAGQVFFGAFQTTSDPANLCSFGHSRLFGVHYYKRANPESSDPLPEPALPSITLGGESDGTRVMFYDQSIEPSLSNSLLTGLRVASRPTCASRPDEGTGVYPPQQPGGGAASPQYQLVGQLGGAAGRAGGSVGELAIGLPPPTGVTRASDFAGSVD